MAALTSTVMLPPMRALFLLIVGLVWPGGQQPAPRSQDPLAPLAPRTKGRTDAPVVVYEMSDFQCPFCRRFALETFPVIERDYILTGKVRWVFVNFPLSQIHRNAVAAAQVAMCAARQGKFWPVHDLLYQRQPQWAPLDSPGPLLLALADSAGATHDSIVACLERKATVNEIAGDAEGARRAGATGTPTFYIEGGIADGFIPAPDFSRILDSIYRAKTAGAHR